MPETSDHRTNDPIARWLIEDAWKLDSRRKVVGQLGTRMAASGIPLWRLNYLHRTLHPELLGSAFVWTRGEAEARRLDAGHALLDTDEFRNNPVSLVYKTGETVRRRLVGDQARLDFPILEELRAEGATDYLILPVAFSAGHIDAVSVTSDAAEGFSGAHFDHMFALLPLFARIVEVHAVRRVATNLLDTYVGHDAGARILAGRIRRGDGETIRAAIWSCDLRGFTPLSESMPRDRMIALLNDFFERMATPIGEHGGEVLKFIGDSVLAIFRADDQPPARVCAKALDAALAARAAMTALNEDRAAAGEAALGFGLALHFGDVMYGNIGAPGRLDFTVIGPAVNLVSRIEGLTKSLGTPLLTSSEFASHLPDRLSSQGAHTLRGVGRPHEVFAPRLMTFVDETFVSDQLRLD